MYIRQTTTQRKSDGTIYHTYRLVESTRIENKVRQHTLLNPGSQYPVPREQWGVLTDRVDDILHHQRSLFSLESDIETEAQRIAKKLMGRNREYAAVHEEQAESDYRTVDVDTLQSSNFDQCNLDRMYRVSDKLLKDKDILEAHLFNRESLLFNLDCTITLYDLTNTFFEGTARA